jgi:hypothetical protein
MSARGDMRRTDAEVRTTRRISDAPMPPDAAAELLRRIVQDGAVAWSGSGLARLEAAGLAPVDCLCAMRDGVADPARHEEGHWRYRVHGQSMCVVVVFRSETEVVIVDAWTKVRR